MSLLSAPKITPAPFARPSRRRWSATHLFSAGLAGLTLLALTGAVGLLIYQSIPVWRHSGAGYLSGTKWFFRQREFGSLPMLYGTSMVALIALISAGPIGIGAAIFTAEYLPARARMLCKLAIELLAGIPSVVYGLLGILLLRDYVYEGLKHLGLHPLSGDSLLTAGLLLAIMILPTVTTLADDALRAVPSVQRTAARGMGLSKAQGILFVAMPQARSGLIAALLLGLGRAVGETIAVYLVVGRRDNYWPAHLLSVRPIISAGQTLTSKLGGPETNIAYGDPLHWAAMVGLGLILLVGSAGVVLIGASLGARGDSRA